MIRYSDFRLTSDDISALVDSFTESVSKRFYLVADRAGIRIRDQIVSIGFNFSDDVKIVRFSKGNRSIESGAIYVIDREFAEDATLSEINVEIEEGGVLYIKHDLSVPINITNNGTVIVGKDVEITSQDITNYNLFINCGIMNVVELHQVSDCPFINNQTLRVLPTVIAMIDKCKKKITDSRIKIIVGDILNNGKLIVNSITSTVSSTLINNGVFRTENTYVKRFKWTELECRIPTIELYKIVNAGVIEFTGVIGSDCPRTLVIQDTNGKIQFGNPDDADKIVKVNDDLIINGTTRFGMGSISCIGTIEVTDGKVTIKFRGETTVYEKESVSPTVHTIHYVRN